jgi:glucose/arabinose dehydrogenase
MFRILILALALAACFRSRPSKGGGEISARDSYQAARETPDPADIEVPPGYRIELVSSGLTFPTGIAFGDRGRIFVVESGYSYGEKLTTPRIIELVGGNVHELATGDPKTGGSPWNGIAFHDGALYVAQGGQLTGGRIARYPVTGERLGDPAILVDKLPSLGDHHTDGPVVRDGWVYFGQGTATNSGIVGKDNADFGWLARHPEFHDVPCEDVRLAGVNITAKHPLRDEEATTGAYVAFGTPTTPGQVIKGRVPCTGAVMRVRTTGGPVELVAWGFRNPYGLAFDRDGTLYVTDNGADTRGSRPVFGAADMLWRVERGRWYGWPDHAEGRPLTAGWYSEAKGDTHGFVLADHPSTPPEPAVYFPVHASADGFDFSTSPAFGHVGQAFVALFGDQAPTVGKTLHPVGFAVMKADPRSGELEYFARNRPDRPGPASKRDNRGLERPIAARFSPDGSALYIVDFGVVQMTDNGANAIENTGRVWRIVKEVNRAR